MKTTRMALFRGLHTAQLILFVSGFVAVAIALAILFAPEAFYGSYGIDIAGNATLVNELKAPAGALFLAGILMFAGVVRRDLTVVSLTTAAVVYLSYGLSRVMSIALDGLPDSGMVGAAGFELLVGAVCLATLVQVRRSPAPQA